MNFDVHNGIANYGTVQINYWDSLYIYGRTNSAAELGVNDGNVYLSPGGRLLHAGRKSFHKTISTYACLLAHCTSPVRSMAVWYADDGGTTRLH